VQRTYGHVKTKKQKAKWAVASDLNYILKGGGQPHKKQADPVLNI
jgi:hypothetical protein